jgi:2-iminobutanoate/2-iminopropanoate deaminase
MKKIILLSMMWLLAVAVFAQQKGTLVQLANPATVATPKGYSHAAIIDLGNCKMMIISGQVALDSRGNLVGKDDVGKQAEQIFTNLKSIVEAGGGKMGHIVKLGYFTTDVSQIQQIRNVRDKFIDAKNPPASTLVQVSKLYREDVLLEIEATAVIPKPGTK